MYKTICLLLTMTLITATTFAFGAPPQDNKNTIEEVGRGLSLGGTVTGSNGIALIGILAEYGARAIASPKKGTPEFEAKRKKLFDGMMASIISQDFNANIKADMTEDQVVVLAKSYCDELDKRIATGTPVVLKREQVKKAFYFSRELIPEEEEFTYIITQKVFDDCTGVMVPHAKRMLARIKND